MLDSGRQWDPEGFQLEVAEDILGGALETWLVIPEGNGKTTFMGGFSLYHGDHVETANVLLAAASRDQCGILLGQAAGFVYRTRGLERRFEVLEGYRRIRCLRTHGKIQVFAADDRTGDGEIPSLALLDELHRHRDMRLYRIWRGKLDKREGQMVAISTAGEPGTEFEVTREKVRTQGARVVDGQHVRAELEGMVLHDFAVRPDQDPEDMEIVKAANPLSTVTVDKLSAKRNAPTMTLPHWLRFTCNLATRAVATAIGEAEWSGRRSELDEIPVGEPVDVGLDIGWKWDATVLTPLWMPEDRPRLFGAPTFVIPPRDGNSMHPARIEEAFRALHARNPIRRIVMDPSAGGEQLAFWLEFELGCEVVAYEQQPALMAQVAEKFLDELRSGGFEHVGDPDLTRHVLNAVARELPNRKVRFDRPARARGATGQDETREIDGLIAASLVLHASFGASGSVYEERDLLILG